MFVLSAGKVEKGKAMLAKYRNQKVSHAGYSFGSKLEMAVWDLLKLRERAREITDLKTQVSVYLTDARIQYIADFQYVEKSTGNIIYAEAKGLETDVWRIKLRLYRHYGPAPLEIYKGTYKKIVMTELVIPKHLERVSECPA